MKSITFYTEIVIDANIDSIWNLLVDLSSYSKWNPWVIEAFGDVVPGGYINVKVIMNDKIMKASHIMLDVEKNRRLCWKDAGWNSLFVYAQRSRDLEELPNGKVLLTQTITANGILSSFVKYFYGKSLQKGIEDESNAIKLFLENNNQ